MGNSAISLNYDPTRVLAVAGRRFEQQYHATLAALETLRNDVLDDADQYRLRTAQPHWRKPLDAAFMNWPVQLLEQYNSHRTSSQLWRMVGASRRMAEAVDRVVVLGIGGSYMGARALFEACCHPYWNELNRGERASFPRIYFEGNNVDNDAMQGLFDLFVRGHGIASENDRWGIVAISKSGGTLETAAALWLFLKELLAANNNKLTAGDSPLLIPVTGTDSAMHRMLKSFGCSDDVTFEVPDGIGGRFSVLTAVGLIPAAVLGLDVVKLLEGAASITEHFRTAPPEDNLVLQYTAICHLAEAELNLPIRVLTSWGKTLEALGLWYDQLLAESLGKHERGATPMTIVNTRDLHSRGQQHQDGRRDKLITNLIIDSVRRDRLAIPRHEADPKLEKDPRDADELNKLAGKKTVPDIMQAAIAGTNEAYATDGRPTADLRLARGDEYTMGQLLQMLMLATVVEGRHVGTNPYGQPGVEAYKKFMQANLKA